jgi:uncharacterized protein (DUF4415 family)
MSEEHIVRYTADELAKMRARGESQMNWEKLDALAEEELEEAIASDPDSAISPEDWQDARLGIPETIEPKKHMSFRIDADVWRWFKAHWPLSCFRAAHELGLLLSRTFCQFLAEGVVYFTCLHSSMCEATVWTRQQIPSDPGI